MKLCFSTLGCHDYSLEEILSLAKTNGIDALEIRGISGELDNGKITCFSEKRVAKTRESFALSSVRPLVLGTSCTFHTPSKYEAALAEGYAAIEIASRIGFSAIRVFGDRIEGDEEECIARVCEGVLTLCRYAERFGVDVYLEVHGEFNTEERLLRVIERCGAHPRFGLIWDVCHTRNTFPDPRKFYDRFAPYIRHVHLKDIKGEKHMLPGEGTLPLKQIAVYLTERGYGGYFSLEWERKWHPELPTIEEALERYLSIMKNEI